MTSSALQTNRSTNDQPFDVGKALQLRMRGMSYEDIGKIVGRTKQAVHHRLQPFISDLPALQAYKDYRADLFAAKQAELLLNLTKAKQKDMSGLQMVTALGILYDKERLERGQATEIVEYNEFEEQTQDLASKKRAIEERLAAMGVDVVDVTPEKVSDTNLEPKSGGMDQAEA